MKCVYRLVVGPMKMVCMEATCRRYGWQRGMREKVERGVTFDLVVG